jgi:hypothetical protein
VSNFLVRVINHGTTAIKRPFHDLYALRFVRFSLDSSLDLRLTLPMTDPLYHQAGLLDTIEEYANINALSECLTPMFS